MSDGANVVQYKPCLPLCRSAAGTVAGATGTSTIAIDGSDDCLDVGLLDAWCLTVDGNGKGKGNGDEDEDDDDDDGGGDDDDDDVLKLCPSTVDDST